MGDEFWVATEAIGGLGLLVVALGLALTTAWSAHSSKLMRQAFASMREAFQIHAGHCHAVTDAQKIRLDLDTTVARITQAYALEEGDPLREHLIERLATCDAPRLIRWSAVLMGRDSGVRDDLDPLSGP